MLRSSRRRRCVSLHARFPVIRLERIESPSDLVGVVDLLREWLRVPEDRDLRRAFTDWVRRIAERVVPGWETLAAEMALEDSGRAGERVAQAVGSRRP